MVSVREPVVEDSVPVVSDGAGRVSVPEPMTGVVTVEPDTVEDGVAVTRIVDVVVEEETSVG